MKKCNKCNVEVNSTRKTCPLCLSVLESDGKEYDKLYPAPKYLPRKKGLFMRLLAFFSVMSVFICAIINFMTYEKGQTIWSVLVLFNVAYFWLLLKSTFKKKGNIPVRLVIQNIAISLLLYGMDFFTGNTGWAINYVVPFITMASLLSILSISIGNKQRYINHFPHIITAILLGFIPLILYLFKWVVILWPSLSAALLSVITILGMIIIGDSDTKEEIKKRFHI